MDQRSADGRFRLEGSHRGGALRWGLTDARAGRLYAVPSRRDGKDLADALAREEVSAAGAV
jgi:hypothetical protein